MNFFPLTFLGPTVGQIIIQQGRETHGCHEIKGM